MGFVRCPDCDRKIRLGSSVETGLTLVCAYCDAELEVINTDPLEVDWAYAWEWEEEEEKVVF